MLHHALTDAAGGSLSSTSLAVGRDLSWSSRPVSTETNTKVLKLFPKFFTRQIQTH